MLVKATIAAALIIGSIPATAQLRDSFQRSISVLHEQNHFSGPTAQAWYGGSIQYAQRIQQHVVSGRVNYINRFGKNGVQYDVEAYPHLGGKWYAYAGVAYSNDVPVYSRWRSGASLYMPLASGWEAEAGVRMLQFDKTIWMTVAGLSAYAGSWLLNARSFLSANQPTQNASFFLTARNYFQSERSFWWVQAGRGISPDESRSVQFQSATKLISNRISSGLTLGIGPQWRWQLMAGWSADEYALNKTGRQFFGSTGIEWMLR